MGFLGGASRIAGRASFDRSSKQKIGAGKKGAGKSGSLEDCVYVPRR